MCENEYNFESGPMEHYRIYYLHQQIDLDFNRFILFAVFFYSIVATDWFEPKISNISILSVDPLSNFKMFHQIELLNSNDSDRILSNLTESNRNVTCCSVDMITLYHLLQQADFADFVNY